mgnify:CR=1 FL=1
MSFRQKSTLFLAGKAILSLALIIFTFTRLNKLTHILDTALPDEVAALNETVFIKYLADQTLYYDEVLTQSARNYAFTRAPKWKNKYLDNEKKLEEVIANALTIGGPKDKRNFEKLNQANIALVKLEKQSFDLTENDQTDQATRVLESEVYWALKERYTESIKEYVHSKDVQIEGLLGNIEGLITQHASNEQSLIINLKVSLILYILLFLLLTWSFTFFMVKIMVSRLYVLKTGAEKIENGDFDYRIQLKSGDEFQTLAATFNSMAKNLKVMTQKVNYDALQRELSLQRNSFSRELHDRLGIIISSLKLQLKQLQPSEKEQNERQLAYQTSNQLVNEAYSQIREISHNPVPESIASNGLKKSLGKLFSRTEMIFPIHTKFITNLEESDFSDQQKASIYALIRELLNNALKHAEGEQIDCQIIKHKDHYLIMFEDDGKGFSPDEVHFSKGKGLQNVKARVLEMQGKLHIDTQPGAGTSVSIIFQQPIIHSSHEEDQLVDLR